MKPEMQSEKSVGLEPVGNVVVTNKGRRWLSRGHPWVYRDDIARADGADVAGGLLAVEDGNGAHLGWALSSPRSRIAARIVCRTREAPDRDFWKRAVTRAIDRRASLGLLDETGTCRLISSDAEGFPGWVVDRYADVLVTQSGTESADRMRDFWIELLLEASPVPIRAIVDRSDATVRRVEKLDSIVEVVHGTLAGPVEVDEDGLRYLVDVIDGHKTGHYLDQRTNRALVARHAGGARVLDAFSYDGLFGIRAALAGAREVLCLDQSREAGERLLANAERNGVRDRVTFERVDCTDDLGKRARAGERYDLVICDPPPFARSRREIKGAERGYVEVNRRSIELATNGGLVFTCSCSHNVRPEDFATFIARAAGAAGRSVFVEATPGAGPDHPVLVTLLESSYLKCALLRVEG